MFETGFNGISRARSRSVPSKTRGYALLSQPGDIQAVSQPGDIWVERYKPGDMHMVSEPGDIQALSQPGDIRVKRQEPGDMRKNKRNPGICAFFSKGKQKPGDIRNFFTEPGDIHNFLGQTRGYPQFTPNQGMRAGSWPMCSPL